MLFTYWTGHPLNSPLCAADWRARFPRFAVFGDDDVLPLLDSDRCRDLYSRISIPACKSDIARLVLLRRHGGLYIDSHVGPTNADRLFETMDALSSADLLLFDKTFEHKAEGDVHLMNSVIAARKHAAVLNLLISSSFENLFRQADREAETTGHVEYNIFAMTGAWDISVRIFDRATLPYIIKPQFATQVHIHKLLHDVDPGFQLYKHYDYRTPGNHWSERQTRERLFLDVSAMT